MMDISDGLASDIQRLMEKSHCGAHIAVDRLPLSSELKEVCHRFGWQAEDLALTAGEDYCLLVTIDPSKFNAIQEEYLRRFQRPLFQVGTILEERVLKYTPVAVLGSGFDHFIGAQHRPRL